jgi:hypothetical protein
MATNNIRFSRILRKYDFLIKELEDVNEMHDEASREFMREVMMEKNGGEEPEPVISEPEEEETPEKVEMSKEYKKLFRKIVVQTHPDKQIDDLSDTEKLKLKEIYDSTIEAWDKGDQPTLISNAVKLDIDVSEFEEDFKEIEEACVTIEERLGEIQATSAWYYKYILKTDEEKSVFIKKFVGVMGDNESPNLSE